ncbi:MAG: hypothetical protein IJP59_08910 [Muribaculaceae bacterium]|nr:hypothetical protein [Muribaculaceae bacterium]
MAAQVVVIEAALEAAIQAVMDAVKVAAIVVLVVVKDIVSLHVVEVAMDQVTNFNLLWL